MPLTRKQLATIHVAKRDLGLADEEYRDILDRLTCERSSRHLDRAGFELAIQHFIRLGWEPDPRFSRSFMTGRPGMASPEQIRMILGLWDETRYGHSGERGLRGWLERVCKVSAVQFLTFEQAPKAITGLKAMKANYPAVEQSARA